jgi:hypothetical protein
MRNSISAVNPFRNAGLGFPLEVPSRKLSGDVENADNSFNLEIETYLGRMLPHQREIDEDELDDGIIDFGEGRFLHKPVIPFGSA